MILINIAALIVIASRVYDIYVNYNVKKQNDSLKEVTEGMKRELDGMKKTVSSNRNASGEIIKEKLHCIKNGSVESEEIVLIIDSKEVARVVVDSINKNQKQQEKRIEPV
ncbi:hypothetical protein [Clostridium sp. UBA1652]|uniref:hypothetical protein n=1 Tax=Clostridium sp. UBA1652 TaxID=1946348 RepID=UPI00257ACAA9|nr:hypothetical protein [Clostridium sp. UBA1652]